MSKKDEQRRRREEKQQAAKRRSALGRLFFWGAVAVFVPLTLYVFLQGLFGGAPVLPPDEIGAADHIRGNPEAAVTLTIYADFQCPACLTETQVIASAWPRIQNDVRLVFRHFPLDSHRHAFLAARYAEAAARQGSFWQMHDLLFFNQQTWAALPDARQTFNGYVTQLGLDIAQLQRDIEDPELRAKIMADEQSGIRAGVRATPTLFVNGRLVPTPRSATELMNLVSQAAGQAAR